jgi:conjugation system TraG family ATPase
MNPFKITKAEYNEEKRQFLKSLIILLWKGADGVATQTEDTAITNCIFLYYRNHFDNVNSKEADLSLNSFYEFSCVELEAIVEREQILFDVKSYRFILKKFYRGGEYDSILNSDVDATLFDEKFIVFEIDAIKDHKILFPITTIIIMDVFLQKMRHKNNRKALIIEEAWKAIASPNMAGYIVYLYKTVRKFWGEAVVVTQELEDIISNEIVKNSIISNSDTIVLLDQTKFRENYDQVSELLNLSRVERNKIFTINQLDNKSNRNRFKEFYIKRGDSGEVYGAEVSIYQYLTYTTEKKEKDALSVYLERFGTYEEALDSFVDDLTESKMSISDFADKINLETNTIEI